MKVRITTRTYEVEMGHKPRGRGWWTFRFLTPATQFEANAPRIATWTDARKWAEDVAATLGDNVMVDLMPSLRGSLAVINNTR